MVTGGDAAPARGPLGPTGGLGAEADGAGVQRPAAPAGRAGVKPETGGGQQVGPDPQADDWLISHAVRGNHRAYEELVRRHQDRAYRIAYRMLGNRHDAEDVAQDVLLQLWISLASFTGSASFTTWLYRSVVNRAISVTRKPHRRTEQPHDDQDRLEVLAGRSSVPSGEDVTLASEQSRAIASAVAELSPDLRSVFVLRHFEGLTYEQIGEVLGLSEPTVRGRLVRSRQQLTARLREWR